ncbi:hypothetical protein K458DRAFT_347979 [Lentithecium fluviatile CBS 122367]|uniref:Zn(2)-C6 fungal-type domain-containing protein n=1 Tax=Lentithecium fluviatile CBS 122367 TaxID=1168545 RepID=A0A6G1ILB3_9PLEO|nr:hypothetical protein K458DRAFT_347979 [Lentithecium fluviatile CBS 122367]
MPKEPPNRGPSSRQRPVSCSFCRTRKLRCSRDAPCTNCKSRGIECELETLSRLPNETDGPSKAELLDRVRALEELLENSKKGTPLRAYLQSPSQGDGDSATTKHVSDSNASTDVDRLESDVAWLSSIYDGSHRSPDDFPPDSVAFRICSVQHTIATSRSMSIDSSSPANTWPRKLFWLPQYSEAKILLDKFIQHVEHIHHVFYVPSLPTMLDRVYTGLSQQGHIKSGEMVLLFSIFASASRSWTTHDYCKRGLFSTSEEAHIHTEHWARVAQDLLDLARRTTHVSIEGVQATIVLLFVPYNLEAFWRRSRSIHNTGLLLARELGLHCIDLPSKAHLANTIQAEIGRRVWWHLVASDWAVSSRIDDIPRGFYQCHLRHMMTHKPLNVDDEDLVDGMCRVGRPISEPTTMSYSMFRIRVCEASRNLVDRTPVFALNGDGPSYDVVMDIDTEMQLILSDIPPFFSMSVAELMGTYGLDHLKAAGIARQGHIFRSLCHGQRCKLHLPYLGRGYKDPKYALSRAICVQSARLVIANQKDSVFSGLCESTRFKPLALIMAVFVSCIVLLMDLCQSKGSPHQERQREDITSAFRLLEDSRHDSKMAAKLITSMLQVLHKHRITPPNIPPSSRPPAADISLVRAPSNPLGSYAEAFSANALPTSDGLPRSTCVEASVGDLTGSGTFANDVDFSYFPDLAQSLDQGMDIDNFNWNDLFSDLESSFM